MGVSAFIAEEQPSDTDLNHTGETTGWRAADGAVIIWGCH